MKFLFLSFFIFLVHCDTPGFEPPTTSTNPETLAITPIENQTNSETSKFLVACQFVDEFSQCITENSNLNQLVSCSNNFSNNIQNTINTDEDTTSPEITSFQESVTTYNNCIQRIRDRVEEETIVNEQLVISDALLCTESYMSQTEISFLCE